MSVSISKLLVVEKILVSCCDYEGDIMKNNEIASSLLFALHQ